MAAGRASWLGPRTDGPGGAWWWGRGYAFTPTGRLLEDHEIGRALSAAADAGATATTLNGCFAAAFGAGERTTVVTDRYGTVPVFLGRGRHGVVASDDVWSVVAAQVFMPRLDPVAVVDMLRLGYVPGERTLVDGVASLQLGTVAVLQGDVVSRNRYWRISYPDVPRGPSRGRADRMTEDARWLDALDAAYSAAGERVDAFCAARGRTARVMGTGGLDSRAIVGLLATRTGTPGEITSYGARVDRDMEVARQIATEMGWVFHAVPIGPESIDDDTLRAAVREVGVSARFTCGAGARAVPAADDTVTMCGHTGFLSSDMQRQNLLIATPGQLRRMIELVHFTFPRSDELVARAVPGVDRARWSQGLEESLADADPARPIEEMHRWAAENRHRKLVHLEAQVYARRGAWMYPLHDHAIVDVFVRIPWRLRVAQRLYARHALDRLFTGPAAPLAGIARVGHGGTFTPRRWLYPTFEATQLLQPAAGALVTRAGPAATRAARRFKPEGTMTSGANPLRHWFHTDARVRDFVTTRLGDIGGDLLDGPALRAIALDERTGESAFQRLVAGALTIAACEDEATTVWRLHAAARSA
jgi:hypothetical protein